MTEYTNGAVMSDGELSEPFNIDQGIPQGCTSSPTAFQVFIVDLLKVADAGWEKYDSEVSDVVRCLRITIFWKRSQAQ